MYFERIASKKKQRTISEEEEGVQRYNGGNSVERHTQNAVRWFDSGSKILFHSLWYFHMYSQFVFNVCTMRWAVFCCCWFVCLLKLNEPVWRGWRQLCWCCCCFSYFQLFFHQIHSILVYWSWCWMVKSFLHKFYSEKTSKRKALGVSTISKVFTEIFAHDISFILKWECVYEWNGVNKITGWWTAFLLQFDEFHSKVSHGWSDNKLLSSFKYQIFSSIMWMRKKVVHSAKKKSKQTNSVNWCSFRSFKFT